MSNKPRDYYGSHGDFVNAVLEAIAAHDWASHQMKDSSDKSAPHGRGKPRPRRKRAKQDE